MMKSSTSEPSAPSAWARTPGRPVDAVVLGHLGTYFLQVSTNSFLLKSRTISSAPIFQCLPTSFQKPGKNSVSRLSRRLTSSLPYPSRESVDGVGAEPDLAVVALGEVDAQERETRVSTGRSCPGQVLLARLQLQVVEWHGTICGLLSAPDIAATRSECSGAGDRYFVGMISSKVVFTKTQLSLRRMPATS